MNNYSNLSLCLHKAAVAPLTVMKSSCSITLVPGPQLGHKKHIQMRNQ